MNKQDELQAQRNELFDHSTDTLARIKELDKELQAVIDKKKEGEVKHGDVDEGGAIYIETAKWISKDRQFKPGSFVLNKDGLLLNLDGKQMKGRTIVSNIFDDLTETSEGFEMENGGGYTTLKAETGNSMDNGVRIHHGTSAIVIGGSVLDEFISNICKVRNGLRSKT